MFDIIPLMLIMIGALFIGGTPLGDIPFTDGGYVDLAYPQELKYVFSMCAVFPGGTWDCDEKWVVYMYDVYDVYDICHPGIKGVHFSVNGCAMYDDDRGYTIVLGNSTERSHTGHYLLEHEIIHMQCLCNFHGDPQEEPKR